MNMKVLRSLLWLGSLLRNISAANDDGYVPFVVITILSFFPHSCYFFVDHPLSLFFLSFDLCIVCPLIFSLPVLTFVLCVLWSSHYLFWPLYCVSFDLLIICFDLCIVCPLIFSLPVLTFVLCILWSSHYLFWDLQIFLVSFSFSAEQVNWIIGSCEQYFSDIMIRTGYFWWNDYESCFVLDEHSSIVTDYEPTSLCWENRRET